MVVGRRYHDLDLDAEVPRSPYLASGIVTIHAADKIRAPQPSPDRTAVNVFDINSLDKSTAYEQDWWAVLEQPVWRKRR